jgi:hypothetical protein
MHSLSLQDFDFDWCLKELIQTRAKLQSSQQKTDDLRLEYERKLASKDDALQKVVHSHQQCTYSIIFHV